jgi:hypothetical protein
LAISFEDFACSTIRALFGKRSGATRPTATIASVARPAGIWKGRPPLADFPTCYAFVLGNEDYTPPRYETKPDPTRKDPHALAISGINSAAFPADFKAIFYLPMRERALPVEVFYGRTFWNPWIAQLKNPIAMRVMDAEVNSGGEGVRLLQRAVNSCRGTTGFAPLAVDGAWGTLTVVGANGCNQTTLVNLFKAARVAFYEALAAENPAEAPNLAGWLARARK